MFGDLKIILCFSSFSEFIDIKGEEDNPELKRPNKINKEYKIEQNDLTKEQYDLLNENFSETQKEQFLLIFSMPD
jgi:hypothetical protein